MGVDVGYIGEGDGAAGNPPVPTDGKTKTLGVSAPCSSPSKSSGVPGSSSTPGILEKAQNLM